MKRQLILAAILAVALGAWGIKACTARRGGINLRVENCPLGEVIRKLERAGRIDIATNLDPATPITLRLQDATLPDAIDQLAAAADARWRLCYAFAPNQKAIGDAIARWAGGDQLADWRWLDHPLPLGMFFDAGPSDPRHDPWPADLPGDKPLAEFLDAAAERLDNAFALPTDWNATAPKDKISGPLDRAVAKVAQAAKGVAREIFLVRGRPAEAPSPGADGGAPERRRFGDRGGFFGQRPPRPEGSPDGPPDSAAMEARLTAQIEKLPPAEQAAAKAEFDRFRQMREALRDLPEDQRREKMREMFQDPAFQERMDERMAARDSRRTPEQRRERYRHYVERKANVKGETK